MSLSRKIAQPFHQDPLQLSLKVISSAIFALTSFAGSREMGD